MMAYNSIEFKTYLFGGADHEKVLSDLWLLEDENEKPKAVLQLISTIKETLIAFLAFDTNASSNKAIIYPILVVHYRMFNTAGINKLIDEWFSKALLELKNEGLSISNVRSLIIIDMDTLMYNSHFFETRKLSLEECLLEYHKNYLKLDLEQHSIRNKAQADDMISESFASFAHFIDNKIDRSFRRPKPTALVKKMISVVKK